VIQLEYVLGHDDFARKLANEMGCEFREFREEYYVDGEPCPRVLADYKELIDRDILVVSRLNSPVNTQSILASLHTLNRVTNNITDKLLYGARNVDVLLPYFVLSRQDHNPRTDKSETVRNRDKGKDVGYRNVLKDLEARDVRRILTLSPHFSRSGEGSQVFREIGRGIEVYRIPGVNALARYFKGRVNSETIVINPDMASGKLAVELARLTDTKFKYGLEKKRLTDRDVETKGRLDAERNDVIIVDDIASSGSTLVGAIDSVDNPGTIYLAVVHPVLPDMSTSEKGYGLVKRLLNEKKIADFVATDTINSEFSKASIIQDIVRYYKGHKS
jgi:phosphoribosylpyrophosphate synthetase